MFSVVWVVWVCCLVCVWVCFSVLELWIEVMMWFSEFSLLCLMV